MRLIYGYIKKYTRNVIAILFILLLILFVIYFIEFIIEIFRKADDAFSVVYGKYGYAYNILDKINLGWLYFIVFPLSILTVILLLFSFIKFYYESKVHVISKCNTCNYAYLSKENWDSLQFRIFEFGQTYKGICPNCKTPLKMFYYNKDRKQIEEL